MQTPLQIRCPYCSHLMAVTGAKPGTFNPKCAQCRERFQLVISPDATVAPRVIALGEHVDKQIASVLGLAPTNLPKPAPKPPHQVQPAAPARQRPGDSMAGGSVAGQSFAGLTSLPEPAGNGHAQPQTNGGIMATSAPPASPVARPATPPAPAKPARHDDDLGRTSAPPPAMGLGAGAADLPVPQPHAVDRDDADAVSRGEARTSVAGPATVVQTTEDLQPETVLGGYQVQRKLGQGGMGAVYRARQLSLDRDVALKVLAPALSGDPAYVARFTREAYAAAQLTHHNVVQIIDIGHDKGVDFFSMEFVRGENLGQVLKHNGKLDAETAVSYVLQAARGLKFAHDQGLIHRDIKPENLMLNDQGILKVADLGLVKKLGAAETQMTARGQGAAETALDKTQMNVSMGTPAYMPPEQATDAANVDQRADIYSLGCTLYHLVAGRPPFTGRTAIDVITKHQRDPVVPPDAIAPDVPKSLSSTLLKMLAKKPAERFQTMREVITSLEDFLGVATAGPFTAKEEQVRNMEFAASTFGSNLWYKLRDKLLLLAAALTVIAIILCALVIRDPLTKFGAIGGLIGLGVQTFVAYQITLGVMNRTAIWQRVRGMITSAGFVDWVTWGAGLLVLLFSLYTVGWLWWWLGALLLSVGLAQAFYWTVDYLAGQDMKSGVVQAEHVLKQMRLRGVEENTLRQFVAKHGGENWEHFFEALFGYDAKIAARRAGWGKDRGQDRRYYGLWRDPIIRWIDGHLEARRLRKEQKVLARAEAKALAAKGIGDAIAMKQAMLNAERTVAKAAKLRADVERTLMKTMRPAKPVGDEAEEKPLKRKKKRYVDEKKEAQSTDVTAAPPKKGEEDKTLVKAGPEGSTILDREDDDEFEREHSTYFRRRYGSPIDFLLGAQVRLALAAVCLIFFGLWFQKNQGTKLVDEAGRIVDTTRQIDVTGKDITVQGTMTQAEGVASQTASAFRGWSNKATQQLDYAAVPDFVQKQLGSWNGLLAGVLLLLSCFFHGRIMAVGVLVSSALTLYLHYFTLPVLGSLLIDQAWASALAGLFVWIFAVVFFRTTND
jgi:serine/threonine protein kinase